MTTAAVTAADETFMPLLRGWVLSLQRCQPQPVDTLACFDLGLEPSSLDWLAAHGVQVLQAQWDLPVAADLREQQPHLRALTVRPFLPRYLPGHDMLVWLDADTWVQVPTMLGWLVQAARSGALAAVPEVDRAYRHARGMAVWRSQRMAAGFGAAAGERTSWDRYINAGVYALRADAPHWQAWARHFEQGLSASAGRLVCDQSALNHAMWTEPLPVHPLPAVCNWLCHLALPGYDPARSRFCEPHAPHTPIGIIHLTGSTKNKTVQAFGPQGPQAVSLRFSEAP